ncbi:hypothetical protein ABPG74_015261 [Tetrahymena malaccensis]
MKQHYEDLEKRALENYKKDREIVDHLNDWKYCDPDNNQDELPMPYRYIDELINDEIIKQVLVKVGEIEKQKCDPSYDGQLKVIPPSGDIDSLKSATFISEPKGNPSKHIIMGDKFGNIFIFDQNKKQIVSKFDQLPKKRVIHISSIHTRLIESHVVTIAVIQRAVNKVSILRYIDGENTLQLQFVITLNQQPQTSGQNASSYAYESVISINSTYLALLHYSGNVSIYQIPEPPLQQREVILDDDQQYFQRAEDSIQSQTSFSRNQSPRYERNSIKYKLPVFSAKEMPDLKQYYLIEFKGKKREKKYDEIMKEIQKDNDVLRSSLLGISVEEMYAQIASKQANSQQQQQQQQPQAPAPPNNQKKDAKKPLSKEEIKKEEAAKLAQQQQQQQQKPPDFLKNKDVVFGQDNFDQQYGDISDDIKKPFYQPKVVFLKEKVTFSNKDKQFNKPFTSEIVTGLIITWYNSKNFQYHALNETSFQNLPIQQQYKYIQSEIRQPAQPSSFKPHMTNNYTLIYAITCMDLCESQKFTGFGMKDGNIIIWDNEFQIESKSLQNHSSGITCLAFFHEKYLVSGCNNGYVMMQSLEKENQYQILSNTYKVLKQNPILSLQLNKYGLVLAIDSKKNVRMYNLHHKNKIAALHPKTSYDKIDNNGQKSQNELNWSINPQIIFHLSKDGDQIYILNEEVDLLKLENVSEKEKEQIQKSQKKEGNVQIFKLADCLSTVYEGVRNLFRNGIDKDKILFQFTQMSLADLENKDYSIAGQQSILQNQTLGSLNRKSIALPRFSIHKKALTTTLNKSSVSQSNLKISQQDISNNFSRELSSLKNPFLPNLNKLKDSLSSPKSDYSSINSARKSINFKISSQPQGLTEQKLHPEKFLWKSQYTESSSYDPINNTLIQARERVSRQHLLEESLNKSIIVLEKNLKAKEDEKQARIDLEKKKLLQQSIADLKQKKKKQSNKKS